MSLNHKHCGLIFFVARMKTRMPFRIDRGRPRSLVGQMTDGLRDAIVTGYYKPGDMLPTIHEWTRMYEVSIRVPEGAIANLVKEGLVVTRPRHGCVVQPQPGRRIWLGHVVVVRPADIYNHAVISQVAAMEQQLSLAGYLVTTVVVRYDANDDLDLDELNDVMSRNVSLAILVGKELELLDCLKKSETPFLHTQFDACAKTADGCIGCVRMSSVSAQEDFAAHCERVGTRHVTVIGKVNDRHDVMAQLERRGIHVSLVEVSAAFGLERVENLEREMCRAIDRLFDAKGRKWLPDVIYVEDDYQAIGALFSLFGHGVKIPKDVGFVTVKNYGNGPALPISLSRVEFNPAVSGAAIGKAASAFLKGEEFSYDGTADFNYIIGESFADQRINKTER